MNIEKMSIKEKEQLVNNSGILMHKASLKEYKQALFFTLYKSLNETFSDMYVEVGTYYYNKMKEHINEQATKMYEKFLDRIINNYVINTKKETEPIDQRYDDFKHLAHNYEFNDMVDFVYWHVESGMVEAARGSEAIEKTFEQLITTQTSKLIAEMNQGHYVKNNKKSTKYKLSSKAKKIVRKTLEYDFNYKFEPHYFNNGIRVQKTYKNAEKTMKKTITPQYLYKRLIEDNKFDEFVNNCQ